MGTARWRQLVQAKETHALSPLPTASQTDVAHGVLSADDRKSIEEQVGILRSKVGRRSNKYWENAEDALKVGLDVLADAFPELRLGLLTTAFTAAIAASRGVRANREDALNLGDLILSTAANVMETLSIELPKEVRLDDYVDKLKVAIDGAVDAMNTFCGKNFFSAAWSHKQDARELQSSAKAILVADTDFRRAIGNAALEYCARNQKQQARIEKQLKSLEKKFVALEREAKKSRQRTFNEAVKFAQLVENKRGLIMDEDERTLKLLVEASGSTGDALSQSMAEIGELSHVLQAVRLMEEAQRTIDDLHARFADFEAGEQALKKQVAEIADAMAQAREREQQQAEREREQQQQAEREREQQQAERERDQLRDWIGARSLHPSILSDAEVDLSRKGLGEQDMSAVALLIKFNASLKELWLSDNQIGDKGAAALAQAFPSMASALMEQKT
jgi:flagellar motility protein MotE (MotC chaperone)